MESEEEEKLQEPSVHEEEEEQPEPMEQEKEEEHEKIVKKAEASPAKSRGRAKK